MTSQAFDRDPSDVADAGGLHWAVKQSFVRYVASLPDGTCSVDAGTVVTAQQTLFFPSADDDDAATLRFRGAVRFMGHLGALRVEFGELWIERRADALVLSAETGSDRLRLDLFALTARARDVDEDKATWFRWDCELLAAGVPVFGGNYREGEPFEPVLVQRVAVLRR